MSVSLHSSEPSVSQEIADFNSACQNLLQSYSDAQGRLSETELKLREQRQHRAWSPRELSNLQLCVRTFLIDSKSWHLVVYGSHAVNRYLPEWLCKKPSDYDVFVIGTRKDASDFIDWAKIYFRGQYPDRTVSVRRSLHNPEQSQSILVGAQCALDVTQSDTRVPYGTPPDGDATFESDGHLKYASLSWIADNLQHVLTLDAAAYRHEQDRQSLRRLCYAQCLNQLRNTAQRISADLLREHCGKLFQKHQAKLDTEQRAIALEQRARDAEAKAQRIEQSLCEAQECTAQLGTRANVAESRLALAETRRASAETELAALTQSKDVAIQKLQTRIRELESRTINAMPKKRAKKRSDTRKVDNTTRMIEMFRQSDEAAAENIKLQDTIDKHKKALANALKTLREITEEQKQSQSEIRGLHIAQREKAEAFAILFRKQSQLEFLAQEQRREIEQLRRAGEGEAAGGKAADSGGKAADSGGKAAKPKTSDPQARFTLSPTPEPTLVLSHSLAVSPPKIEVRTVDGSSVVSLQMCEDCYAVFKHCRMHDMRWRIYTNSNKEQLAILSLVGRSDGEESACQRCLLKSYMSDRTSS